MPYYIGDVIKEERKLIARTAEQFAKSGINVKLNTRVEAVDVNNRVVRMAGGDIMPYDILVVATGAETFMPDIPGIDSEGVFTLKDLNDAIRIKSFLSDKNCRRAVIVGAGVIAMEMSEALRLRGMTTQIVYRRDLPVRAWSAEFSEMVLEEITAQGVEFITGESPVAVERSSGSFPLRLVTDTLSLEGDIILFALGVRPNTALARDMGLAIGASGAVQVNFAQQTSLKDVYAVGDCGEVFNRVSRSWVNIPLGDIANKQGRVAGAVIGGHAMSFPGIVGAQSFKVFGLEVATTGLTETSALRQGFHPVSAVVDGTPRARSLGGGETLKLKLIADGSTRKLIGAQAAGHGGVVSRINVLSTCLWNGMNIDEIGYIDLAYSPYFGGAWDPIQIAAQALRRKL